MDTQFKLSPLSNDERQQYYHHLFADKTVPLASLQAPHECKVWPAYADEIWAAFLYHTTFRVNVWVNYDPTSARFYNDLDPRYESCGQANASPSQASKLRATLPPNAELGSITFELGTPFQSLATFSFWTEDSKLDVGSQMTGKVHWHVDNEHWELKRFVMHTAAHLVNTFALPYGAQGLALEDMVEMAGWFRRVQTQEEAEWYEDDVDQGPWTVVSNDWEHSHGWVSLESSGRRFGG
ncbi:uncharacterized protein LTR77_006035 [Saxophila tyrrhenica]|uniref:Uncharacterized protein n=1 Tax=Saxophila tyrrhenica TaxID=1690608 RepID=A0AAV9P8W5_9PEZI|nr:hypothetical protein LTR77_006035 [Saxophila tyrrhenica]